MKDKPFIQECMNENLINFGALAEYLKPDIEKELGKDVKHLAISMALRRYTEDHQKSPLLQLKIDAKSELIAIANQIEIIVKKSSRALVAINKFANGLKIEDGDRLSVIQGSREISIVVNAKHYDKLKSSLSGEKIISIKRNLGIILMYIPKKYIDTPGFFYFLSKCLSFNNVNMLGMSNIKTEVSFLFENDDLPRAYEILCELIPKENS
tara:strand:- start:1472 stop:2101 length:630 start_codon:yes stop_codon:yes gene_type:complete